MRWIKRNAYPLYLFLLGTIPLVFALSVPLVSGMQMTVVWFSFLLFTSLAILVLWIKND